jgi:hypothetical protein
VNGFAEVQALISDNIGISQAELHYCPPGSLYQWMPMERVNGDTFRAVLSWSALNFGSEYYYYISAEDSSSNSNISCSSEFGFQLMTSQLFDDFESGLDKWISEGDWGLQEVRFHSPSHSLRDRVNSGIPSSEQLILTLITPWTPAGLTAFNLEYWTQYFLLPQNDTGYVEIEINGGWDKVDSVIGAIPNWEHRVVNLSEYIDLDSVRIRFRTRADTAFAYPTLGWYVDDIILSSGVVVGCEQDLNEKMRENLEICGISPNPGNQEFSLLFRIPGEGRVQARIYDLTGQLVAKAADSTFPAGNNFLKWNCTSASGIYFLQLEYKGQKKIAKIVVLK